MKDDLEDRLRACEQLDPPLAMRARLLAAAAPLVQPDDSRLDRLWFSRTSRMAAVVAFALLAGVEALSTDVSVPSAQADRRPPDDPVQAVARAASELGFSPDDAERLAMQAIPATSSLTSQPDISELADQ